MPANLTPQYQKAEQAYRRAQTTQERIECLEQMLAQIPKHKGTEKLQAEIKSRLKEVRHERTSEKKAGRKGRSYKIPRQGAGQVILLGASNAGKSRIVAELTHAEPVVAEYPFTTREPMPGMMPWHDVTVQLIDTPPITESHIEPYLTSMVRAADVALLCLDASSDDAPDQTAAVIAQLKSRKTLLADETGFDSDDFATVRIKTRLIATRGDDPDCPARLEYFRELTGQVFSTVPVQLDDVASCERLRDSIYESLNVIRVYTKRPGSPADYEAPYTIPEGGTIEDLAVQVHRDFAQDLKFARIWGTHVHDGQRVGPDHPLADKDLVELHV